MKKYLILAALALFLSFYFVDLVQSVPAATVNAVCMITASPEVIPVFTIQAADTAGPVHITWYVVLLLIIGLYEVVVRIIPAVARFSLIALIIDILKLISDYLKRKK